MTTAELSPTPPAPSRLAGEADLRALLRVLAALAAPVAGALFLVLWVFAETGRAEYDGTSFFVALAGYALAIGLSRALPSVAIGLWTLVPALELAGVLRLQAIDATTWPIALAPMFAAFLVATTRNSTARWTALILGWAHMIVVAALMTRLGGAPGHRNGWLSWTGHQPSLIDGSYSLRAAAETAVMLAFVGGALLTACWLAGLLLRIGADAASAQDSLQTEIAELRTMLAGSSAPEPVTGDSAPSPDPRLEQLTPREREILALVAQGLSNQEIAQTAYISLPTVKTHLRNLMSKLDASSRTQLVALALAAGRAQEPPTD